MTRVSDPDFLNRDLQWLEFNARVLALAEDPRTPLLERVRFLGIYSSNLDEFFMKRVGGWQRRREAGLDEAGLRAEIRSQVQVLSLRLARCWTEELRPALARERIRLVPLKAAGRAAKAAAKAFFEKSVFPVLTPLAVDPGHPFPLVSNLSTSIGVLLQPPGDGETLFARVKIPQTLPQWIPVDEEPEGTVFVSLLDVVGQHLSQLFPGMALQGQMAFRVTRNADVELDTEDAEDLLEAVAEEVRERRFARIVRLEHGPKPVAAILDFIIRELELEADDVYEVASELDFGALGSIADLPRAELHYSPWVPVGPPAFTDTERSVFDVIRERDVLVHHPYESFGGSVLKFIAEAADDPKVLAIKMTLYRTGDASPFLPLLIRAAEAGKQVVCLVELKARFDEARNIEVARVLESAGVHVVYGLLGLKTHCKLALVVRQEGSDVRAYAHVGTGNYHLKTASLYTDLGLFTAREDLLRDVMVLFNALTGRSTPKAYARLLVAPRTMKEGLLERIATEAKNARAGRPARIVAKMNQLEDVDLCHALYDASRAGVKVDLLVRGFCVLRPGVPDLSENIRVVSILGRFLEHSRVYWFVSGHADPLDGEVLIGSADWMRRNLEFRVETLAPVDDRTLKARLWQILEGMLADQRQTWDMQPDGTYRLRQPRTPEEETGIHERLMQQTRERMLAGS